MVATVRMTATTGSHQVVAPMAMRLGMASGRGDREPRDQSPSVVSALPIAANDTKNPRTRMIVTGPVTLDASSVRGRESDPRVPNTVAKSP